MWLCFANAGMLERGNLYCIDHAIRNLPSEAPVLEIGSFCGLSTNLISYYKEKHGVRNRLITCDKWEFEHSEPGRLLGGSKSITHDEYREFVKQTFIRNVQMFSRPAFPYTLEMLSEEFFALWRAGQKSEDVFGRTVELGGPISFAFIDGNHSYEFAKRDFENCDEFLESGGFILFDDSADGTEWEVCKVVKEIEKLDRYEVVVKNPNYLFRKM